MLTQARSGPPTEMLEELEDGAPRLLHADCHILLTACPLPRHTPEVGWVHGFYTPTDVGPLERELYCGPLRYDQCRARPHCLIKQRPLVLTLPNVRSTIFPAKNYCM